MDLPGIDFAERRGRPATPESAFRACEDLARSHYENFSVGTRLIPKDLRRHFYSVYAFCRGVDDLGDEAKSDQLALLDEWERQLRLCYEGTPDHVYFKALQVTVEKFEIPPEPFLKLIEANRRDQRIKRHPDYQELLEYCDHSANPVGRLVLYAFGHREPELHALSDYTCTALQLANFWQDVARDYSIGRIYLPQSDMAEYGVGEDVIERRAASPEFRRLMQFEVDRTKDLFRRGYALVTRVIKPARIDIALFTAGGLSILKAIERQDYDVLTRRPTLSKVGKAKLLATAWIRSKAGISPVPQHLFD